MTCVEKDDLQSSVVPGGAFVRHLIGVQTHPPHLLQGPLVILPVHSGVEEEFRPALRRVSLHGQDGRRTDQDPLVPGLGDDVPPFSMP